jgi:hypothetical protein
MTYSQEYLTQRRYSVYIIADRGRGRYAGLTCGQPAGRAYALRNGNNVDVADWLTTLRRRGEEPTIEVVGTYRSKPRAKRVEGLTMLRLRAEGFDVKNHIFPRQAITTHSRAESAILAVHLPASLKAKIVRRAQALGTDIHVFTESLYRQALKKARGRERDR